MKPAVDPAETGLHELGVASTANPTQAQRRETLFEAYRAVAKNRFDENGDWALPGRSLVAPDVGGIRELYWHALAMLGSSDPGDVARAMPILEKPRQYRCSFSPFAAMQMLLQHGGRLSPKAAAQLEAYIAMNLPKSATRDFQFHGYNDNMPAMKSFALLAAGERFGEDRWVDQGLANLCQLRSVFMRRGWTSEFNSPTYSSITLLALSEIVHHVRNPDAVALARAAGERVFADIASHWHPVSGGPAGAFSRAYTMDSVGHCGMTNMCMWMLLGDEVCINPLRYYFGPESDRVVLHHHGFLPYLQVSAVWHCSADYLEFPDLLAYARDAHDKSVRGTAEAGPCYSGRTELDPVTGSYRFIRFSDIPAPFTAYATAMTTRGRWSMGTSTGQFLDGSQSEVFYLRYALADAARGVEDVRTVYVRYLVGEASCYMEHHENGSVETVTSDLLRNCGSGFAFHHEDTAMYCCRPEPVRAAEAVESLRLRILFYARHSVPERLEVVDGEIVIEDHGHQIRFRPLVQQPDMTLAGAGRIVQGREGDWLYIDLVNYQGPPRQFSKDELLHIGNGFVCEMRSVADAQSLPPASLLDTCYDEQRRITYSRGSMTLATAFDPGAMHIRFMTVNERQIPAPVLEMDGYDVRRLPWVAGSEPVPPPGFDWKTLIETRPAPG